MMTFRRMLLLTRCLQENILCNSRPISILNNETIFICSRRFQHHWSQAVADAEKLVGYTASFTSLQCLLTDEVAQLAISARKLVSRQQHPLFKTAKDMFSDRGDNFIQTWGLTILLISRAADTKALKQNDTTFDGILSSQRNLAEIVELICTANLIHGQIADKSSVANQSGSENDTESFNKDISLGNKLGVLGGDFLLANASVGLAKLKNTFVIDDVAQSIADMTVGQLMDSPNCLEELTRKVYLSHGSVLAHGCKAALRLANHSDTLMNAAFEFGKNLSIAYGLDKVAKKSSSNEMQSLAVDVDDFVSIIKTGVEEASRSALMNLEYFPESEAKKSLESLTKALLV